MTVSRRDFLTSTTGLSVAAACNATSLAAQPARRKYRACVIGDSDRGDYGHNLHKVWTGRDNIEVVGLADPDPEGRAQYAQEAGAAQTYADYRKMLNELRPDLVSIGPRWTDRHQEYLMACVDVGAHGYLEKPISTDLVEADAMVAAVESNGLKWSIAHQKRMCPVVHLCKELIHEKGIIGEVVELRGRGKEDRRAGGEDLVVLGTHIFDLMLFFMGRPQWCMSSITVDGRAATSDDVAQPSEPVGPILGNEMQAMFYFKNSVPGFFSSRKNAEGYPGKWGLDIYGAKGIITIRMGRYPETAWARTRTWAPAKGGVKWEPLPGAVELQGDDPSDVMNAFAIDDLLEAIERDREPGVSLRSGRDCYEMIQAVYAAHINGGRIDLPLVERRHPLLVWAQ